MVDEPKQFKLSEITSPGFVLPKDTTALMNILAVVLPAYRISEERNEALKERNETLEKASLTDPLTGLYNRRHWNSEVPLMMHNAQRNGTTLGILMVDIDKFKSVNDTHGHQAGDAALRHVANILHNGLQRPSDTVFRYGGEELAIVVDGRGDNGQSLDVNGFASIAERLRQALESTPCDLSGVETKSRAKTLPITASFGVAAYIPPPKAQQGETFESWMARADGALYKAKGKTLDGKDDPNESDSRNRVCYDSGGSVTVLDRQPKMPQPSPHSRPALTQTLT